MTVYVFDNDSVGKSSCYVGCTAAWPPVTVGSITGGAGIGLLTREDGVPQATFNGKPLYLFAGDRKAGDAKGDGVDDVWHAVAGDGKVLTKTHKPGYSSGPTYSTFYGD
jgi:predicted lipoprotein with Yx(FWY)xxD motif